MSKTLQRAFEEVSLHLSESNQQALAQFLLGPILEADEIHPTFGPLYHLSQRQVEKLGVTEAMIESFRREEGLT